jgi:hypothetical protein
MKHGGSPLGGVENRRRSSDGEKLRNAWMRATSTIDASAIAIVPINECRMPTFAMF